MTMAKSTIMRVDPELKRLLDQWKPEVSRRKQTSALAKELEKLMYGTR